MAYILHELLITEGAEMSSYNFKIIFFLNQLWKFWISFVRNHGILYFSVNFFLTSLQINFLNLYSRLYIRLWVLWKQGLYFILHIFPNILPSVLHVAQYGQTESTCKPAFGFEVNQKRCPQVGHIRIES